MSNPLFIRPQRLPTDPGVPEDEQEGIVATAGKAARAGTTGGWRERRSASLKALRKAPLTAKIGAGVIAVYMFAAVFAPLLTPYGESQVVGTQFEPWGEQFVLGTDNLGRDMFTRLVYGARNTIGIAFVTTILAFIIGGGADLLAASVGGGQTSCWRGPWMC